MFFKKFKQIINNYLLLDKYWIQYSIIFLLIIIIAFLFPQGKTLKYAYQINDVTRSPIIAPFTYPILKSEEKLELDLEEKKKSIPFVFNRNIKRVDNQILAIEDFFAIIEKLRSTRMRLEESIRLVYERRYHKQYEKAKSEFLTDSTNYSILNSNFKRTYPFVLGKKGWNKYVELDENEKSIGSIKKDKELVLKICRNRWSEGIYDIKTGEIHSSEVTINQGELPDLILEYQLV